MNGFISAKMSDGGDVLLAQPRTPSDLLRDRQVPVRAVEPKRCRALAWSLAGKEACPYLLDIFRTADFKVSLQAKLIFNRKFVIAMTRRIFLVVVHVEVRTDIDIRIRHEPFKGKQQHEFEQHVQQGIHASHWPTAQLGFYCVLGVQN